MLNFAKGFSDLHEVTAIITNIKPTSVIGFVMTLACHYKPKKLCQGLPDTASHILVYGNDTNLPLSHCNFINH